MGKIVLKLSELKKMRDFFLFYTIQEDGQMDLTFKSFSFLDKDENDLRELVEDIESELGFVELAQEIDWEN
jgi:hypothetical protein